MASANELTPEQEAIVRSHDRRLLVLAGPGSGKTFTMVERGIHLLQSRVVSEANHLLYLTFTNKAADEMARRFEERGGAAPSNGTFHSFAYSILQQFGGFIGIRTPFSVIDQGQQEDIFAGIFADYRWTGAKGAPKKFAAWWEDHCRDRKKPTALKGMFPRDFDTVRAEYVKRLRQSGLMDYAGLLLGLRDLLENPEATIAMRTPWKAIFVDEAQDMDPAEFDLVQKLRAEYLTVVGDVDQCAPSGSLVEVTGGDRVAIDELHMDKHRLVSFDRHGNVLVGRARGGRSFRRANRDYDGTLVGIDSPRRREVAWTTPNHRWLVRWTDRTTDLTCVYLMRKGPWWRVGWCQMFTKEGEFHVRHRLKLERADAVWILDTFVNRPDASRYESYVAARYGLPLSVFRPIANTMQAQEWIRSLYSRLASDVNIQERAEACLSDHGRDAKLPLWPPPGPDHQRMGKTVIFQCYAANVLDGLMSVPEAVENDGIERNVNWIEARVSRKHYRGPVHSLDVEKDHTYVQDGLVTGNSIYGWRNADPRLLLGEEVQIQETGRTIQIDRESEWRTLPLTTNWRCGSRIVLAAANLIENNEAKSGLEIKAKPDAPAGKIEVHLVKDHGIETVLTTFVERNVAKARTVAVLTRTNKQAMDVAADLRTVGFKVWLAGEAAALWQSEEGHDLLAILRALINPIDVYAATRAMKVLVPNAIESDLAAARARNSGKGFVHDYAVMNPVREDLAALLEASEQDSENVLMAILDVVQRGSAGEGGRLSTVINAARALADEGHGIADLVFNATFGDDLLDDDPAEGAVWVSTLHKAKGREFDAVLLMGCNKGTWPITWRGADEQEERRSFYVGLTRARTDVLLVGSVEKEVSKFVLEAGLSCQISSPANDAPAAPSSLFDA